MKHTDGVTAQNSYQNNAEMNGQSDDSGGGFLALICATFCKDTPLAEAFGVNDNTNNTNNNQSSPLKSPIQNGEILMMWRHSWLVQLFLHYRDE